MWTSTAVIDDEAIEYRRHVGTVASAEGHETLEVEVVRRDELPPNAPEVAVRSGREEVSVGGVHLLKCDARTLAEMLLIAAGSQP